MKKELKKYLLIFEDIHKNELTRKEIESFNIHEARNTAKNIQAILILNNLHKIIVKKA